MKRFITLVLSVIMITAVISPAAFAEEDNTYGGKVTEGLPDYIEWYYDDSEEKYVFNVTRLRVYLDIVNDSELDYDALFEGTEHYQVEKYDKLTGEHAWNGTDVTCVYVDLYEDPDSVDWADADACKARVYRALEEFSKLEHVCHITLDFDLLHYFDPEELSAEEKRFDVNGDGKRNARDVTALMKGIVDKSSTNDVNGDGKINARDVTALMKAIIE